MKHLFIIQALCLSALAVFASYTPPMKNSITEGDLARVRSAYAENGDVSLTDWLLVVSVSEQKMALAQGGEVLQVFTISTAKAGVGCEANSEKTPLGWHKVTEWIGEKAIPGQVFVSRKTTDEIIPYHEWNSDKTTDKVLTRIMWLDGLENGKNRGGNVDSHSRYIYIHGTNQEHKLGVPSSHGCIRMYNRDVMELFAKTKDAPTFCLILE